jgi:hypothetical protein
VGLKLKRVWNDAEWCRQRRALHQISKHSKAIFTSQFTIRSTFKAELLSHSYSNAVYDIPYCSSGSLLLSNVKKHYFKFGHIRPNPGGESHFAKMSKPVFALVLCEGRERQTT